MRYLDLLSSWWNKGGCVPSSEDANDPNFELELERWLIVGCSEAGSLHPPPNQDHAAYRYDGPKGGHVHLAVTDGVTHGAHGDVAAQTLARHWVGLPMKNEAMTCEGLKPWLHQAETVVSEALAQRTAERGAAVGAAVWLQKSERDSSIYQGWATRVGDCRILQMTCDPAEGWHMKALFEADQTLAIYQPEYFGADANGQPHPNGQQPAHFVGVGRLGDPECTAFELDSSSILILCSDGIHSELNIGLWRYVFDAELPQFCIKKGVTAKELNGLAHRLLEMARSCGSDDDATLILMASRA